MYSVEPKESYSYSVSMNKHNMTQTEYCKCDYLPTQFTLFLKPKFACTCMCMYIDIDSELCLIKCRHLRRDSKNGKQE